MRRGFNKGILPKEAPRRHKRSTPPKKRESLKSVLMEELMRDYREQAGEQYNREDFAKAIGVKPLTARRYFFGYFPHRENFGNIARYFAPLIGCNVSTIKQDLLDTYQEGKNQ